MELFCLIVNLVLTFHRIKFALFVKPENLQLSQINLIALVVPWARFSQAKVVPSAATAQVVDFQVR